MNELIEKILADFPVPVSFLVYNGHAETYVVYMEIGADSELRGDDSLLGYVDYYDFDIYSKGNYTQVIDTLKTILEDNGFVWIPSRSSSDMYETDTGYYHKTMNFAYQKEGV